MTMTVESLTHRFIRVFAPEQATALAETFHDAYATLVRADDFNELKEIVRTLAESQTRTESRMGELAQAQQRTESRMGELAQAQQRTESRMEELAEAQQRTESRLGELAQAQQRTESRLGDLAEAQQNTESRLGDLAEAQQNTDTRLGKLADVVSNLAQEVGGLSRSVSYSLENEAYRQLPAYLAQNHGIVLEERMVRLEIDEEEIDLFALGQRNGQPIVLVGESKLQLDRRRGGREAVNLVLEQLERKVEAVQSAYPEREAVRLLVTHYARPFVREEAQKRNVIVVQSFEW